MQLLGRVQVFDRHQMAVWQLPQARDAFVDGMVDVEVLTLQVGAALPAVVEPDEGDTDVVLRAFADQEGIARDAAGLVNQGRGGRPVGVVEHGVVQRRQDARERGLLAHAHPNTLVIRLTSSRTSRLAACIANGRLRHTGKNAVRRAPPCVVSHVGFYVLQTSNQLAATGTPRARARIPRNADADNYFGPSAFGDG